MQIRHPFIALLAAPIAFFVTSSAAVNCTGTVDLNKLQTFPYKPRIFILSDILNEPDDSMSLVRYLLYANEFDTRGLCATTSGWLRNGTHPEQMRKIVTAYGQVVDNLNNHVHPDFRYQPADHFLSLITSGSAIYGKKALNETISEGAQRLIAALQESKEPLFVPVWGGTNTLAQALQHIQHTMSSTDAAALRKRLRVYTISDQDNTGAWIRAKFPDIFYVVSLHRWNDYGQATWGGINTANTPGVSGTKVLNPWLDANIRLGPLGAEYPQIIFGMEGDTPSFLWLVQNGLGYQDKIWWGGWGGRYGRTQSMDDADAGFDDNLFVDSTDNAYGFDGVKYSSNRASIWRWREAYMEDFAARMQWALTPSYCAAGHPPVVDINGQQGPDPVILKGVESNQTFVLDASATIDTDSPGDNSLLEFQWFVYNEPTAFPGLVKTEALAAPPGTNGLVKINEAGFGNVTLGNKVKVTAPEAVTNVQTGQLMPDFHVLLQVTNRAGPHPVTRYKRTVFEYSRGSAQEFR